MTPTRDQVPALVDAALEAREELVRRGLSPIESLLMAGVALGTMLGAAAGWGPN